MERVTIQILKVVDAGHLWVAEVRSQSMSDEAKAYVDLCDQMKVHAESTNMPAMHVHNPPAGKICLGKRRKDGLWYRVRVDAVMQTRQGHQASCFLLDHATTEMITIQHLREVPQEFLLVPFQAKQCFLAGIEPVSMRHVLCEDTGDIIAQHAPCDKWDESAIKFARGVFENIRSSSLEVVSRNRSGQFKVQLYLDSITRGELCFNDLLIEMKFARSIISPGPTDTPEPMKISSDSDTDKPTRTRRRRQMVGFDRFTRPGDPFLAHLRGSPSNSCTESDRDSHVATPYPDSTRGTDTTGMPPLVASGSSASDSSDSGRVQRTSSSRIKGSTSMNQTVNSSRGHGVLEARGVPKSPSTSASLMAGVGRGQLPEQSSPGIGRGTIALGRGQSLLNSVSSVSPEPGMSSSQGQRPSPVMGRGQIPSPASVNRNPTNVGSRQVSPAGPPTVVGGRGKAMMEAARAVSAESSECESTGYGRGRGLTRTPGRSSDSSPGSHGARPDISKDTHEPTNLGLTVPSVQPDPDTCSPVITRGAGRARSTALTRFPRVNSQSPMRKDPDVSQDSSQMKQFGHSGTPSPLIRRNIVSGDNSSPGIDGRSKKNVSFSDQEEFFSIPGRGVVNDKPKQHCPESPDISQDDSWSGDSPKAFRPSGIANNPVLQMFAAAKSSFSAVPQAQLKESLDPEEYGVQVHGPSKPKFSYQVKDIDFSEPVKRVLANRDIKKASTLQMYMWPALLRGYDAVAVGCRMGVKDSAGKTISYLAPVLTQLGHTSSYSSLPVSYGPYVLILVPSTQDALRINHDVEMFQREDRRWRTLVVFAGGAEGSRDIELINGCEVLVATPHSLLRLLDKRTTCFDRLAHLILESGEKLLEDFGEQITEILKQYNHAVDLREEKVVAPKQIIAVANQWTPDIRKFAEVYMDTPTVVIASKMEAAFAGGVQQMALMMEKDQRLEQLLGQVQDLTAQHYKVLVFVDKPHDADMIHQLLQSYSIVSLCAHENMVELKQDEVNRQWNLPHRSDSLPVLVLTDEALDNLKVRNAECIIHFDVPEKKRVLEERLWCMHRSWHGAFEATMPRPCQSYLYMTRDDEHLAARVIKLVERSCVEVPAVLVKMADNHQERTEQGTRNLLCPRLKAYGYCRQERRCRFRHNVFHSLDSPGQNPKHIKVPTQGKVKVLITYVTHASQYYGRLLEVKDDEGQVTRMGTEFCTLVLEMSTYFAHAQNRTPCDYVEKSELYAWEDVQHIFHRVEVYNLSEIGTRGIREYAVVFFVDTGNKMEVKSEELLMLPEDLKTFRYQAVEIFVCRLKPTDQDTEWTRMVSAHIAEEIQNKELAGTIVLSLGHTMWLEKLVHYARLAQLQQNIIKFSVRALLLNEDMAEENATHIEQLMELSRGKVDIPSSQDPNKSTTRAITVHGMVSHPLICELPTTCDHVDVQITATDTPDLFFVQQHQHQDKILDMNYDIKEYVRLHDRMKLSKIQKSTLVVALFPDPEDVDKTAWNRGKIAEVLEDDLYDVFFVDSGETETVHISEILPLPSRFQLTRFYAIECCMDGVEPIGEEWTDEAGDWLYYVSRKQGGSDDSRRMMAKVVSTGTARHTGKILYGLQLFDVSNEYDINLGHRLIFDGLAKVSSKAVMEMFSELAMLSCGSMGEDILENCQIVVHSQDSAVRRDAAKIIYSNVIANSSDHDPLVMSGIVCALCRAIQLSRDPDVLEPLLQSYVALVNNVDRESLVDVEETKTIGSLCWTLDTVSDPSLTSIILGAFKSLVIQKVYRVVLFSQGGPRILGQLLASAPTSNIREHSADILHLIFQQLSHQELSVVVRSGCLEVISDIISDSPQSHLVTPCLCILETLASTHKQMRDTIRKAGGVKAICIQLENFAALDVKAQAVHTLKSLANNNRFSKDLMNDLKVSLVLQRLTDYPGLSPEARSTAAELAQRLRDLLPSSKIPSKKTRDHNGVTTHGHPTTDNSVTTSMDGIRPLSNKGITNKPLPPKFCSYTDAIKSAKPSVKWSQDRWNLCLTVNVKNIKDKNIAHFTDNSVSFRAVSDSTEYAFVLHLYEIIQPSKCEIRVSCGSVMLGLRKKTRGSWPRICKEKHKPVYLIPDLDRFNGLSSEDELDEEAGEAEEPKESPLFMSNMTRVIPSFMPASVSTRHRYADGIPPELVLHSSSDDADDPLDDTSGEEYREDDPNKRYGYHTVY